MKTKKVSTEKATEYPSYADYHRNRKSILKQILLQTTLIGASSLCLLACDNQPLDYGQVVGNMPDAFHPSETPSLRPSPAETAILPPPPVQMLGKIPAIHEPVKKPPESTEKDSLVPLDENEVQSEDEFKNRGLPDIPEREN